MATPAAVLEIFVTANTGQATASLTRLDAQLAGTAKRGRRSTGALGSYMKSFAQTGALAAAVVGAASVKMALDYEDSMNKVRNLVGSSKKQVDEWSKALLDLAPAVGKSPKELADALYYVASSGVKTSKVLNTVKISAEASALGLGDTQTVADALTSAMNAYAKSGLSARDATNVLIKTVKYGKLEADSLAESIGRVIPIASKLKVPFSDVGAALASMSLQGLDAAEATTALRGIFSATLKPTDDARKALKSVGLSVEDLRQSLAQRGTLATLEMLSSKFKGNEEAMARVFPNIRALVGAFNLTGDSVKRNGQIFDGMRRNTDDLGRSWNEFQKTPAQKVRMAIAFVQAQMVRLGTAIIDIAFNKIPKIVHALVEFYRQSKVLQAVFAALRDVAKRTWSGIVDIVRGSFQMIKGLVEVISGVLTLRFGRAWQGVKDIFSGSLRYLLGILKAATAPFRAAGVAIGNALGGAFKSMWRTILQIFEDGANAVLDVVQGIADVINVIPGVPDIHIPDVNITGGSDKPAGGGNVAKGRHFKAKGGMIGGRGLHDTVPIWAAPGEAIVNRHQQPEVQRALAVSKALGIGQYGSLGELFAKKSRPHYMAQGGFAGMQAFGLGGTVSDVVGGAASAVGSVVNKGASFFIDKLPKPHIPGILSGLGPYLIAHVSDYIRGGFQDRKFGKFIGLGGVPGSLQGAPEGFRQLAQRWKPSRPRWDVWQMGLLLQSLGFQVAENPHFGGVHPVHTTGSYHYQGRAIDVNTAAGGAAELAAFRKILPWMSKFAPKDPLLEDIGTSNQHMHYAYARGGYVGKAMQKLASGGFAKGPWAGSSIDRTYPTSDGYHGAKLPFYVIAALAEWAGLPGITMAQITKGESMGHPGMDIPDPPGRSRGLWAINSHYNPGWSSAELRNPILNALAARKAAPNGPTPGIWHGNKFVTGWNLHYTAHKPWEIARHIGGHAGKGAEQISKADQKAAQQRRRAAARIKRRTQTVLDLYSRLHGPGTTAGGVGPANRMGLMERIARFWHYFLAREDSGWSALEKQLDGARTGAARAFTLRSMLRYAHRNFNIPDDISGHTVDALRKEKGPMPGYDTPADRKAVHRQRVAKLGKLKFALLNAASPQARKKALDALRDFWALYGVFGPHPRSQPHFGLGGADGVGLGGSRLAGTPMSRDWRNMARTLKARAYSASLPAGKLLAAESFWVKWAEQHGRISSAPEDKLAGRLPAARKAVGSSDRIANLQNLLRMANLRLAVSQAQYPVLAGAMAHGGVSRGGWYLVGEHGPELARLPSGTRVHSNAESRQMVSSDVRVVIEDHRTRVFVDGDEVRAIVKDETRKAARRAGRPLPGRAGGRL